MTGSSFVRWLHIQAKGDPDRAMPYAAVYEIGPLIEATIGLDGDFDMALLSPAIRSAYPDSRTQMIYLESLVDAETVWRLDEHVREHPEAHSADSDVKTTTKVACGFRGLDGEPCELPTVVGMSRCKNHGGAITDPQVRTSILLSSYARMIEGSDTAVAALIEVARDGRSELARVQAAKELLDRAGLVQDQHVHLHADDDGAGGGIHELRKHLDEVRSRLSEPIALSPVVVVPPDEEIADAELVDDEPAAESA